MEPKNVITLYLNALIVISEKKSFKIYSLTSFLGLRYNKISKFYNSKYLN